MKNGPPRWVLLCLGMIVVLTVAIHTKQAIRRAAIIESVKAQDFALPAQDEPTLRIHEAKSPSYYALATRCDEKTPADCRLWHVADVSGKSSIRYDRDTGELWRCGPISVATEEVAKDCKKVEERR